MVFERGIPEYEFGERGDFLGEEMGRKCARGLQAQRRKAR